MKTTNTLARRAALMTVLILGSSAWLSAQDTNQDRIKDATMAPRKTEPQPQPQR